MYYHTLSGLEIAVLFASKSIFILLKFLFDPLLLAMIGVTVLYNRDMLLSNHQSHRLNMFPCNK